MAKATKQPTLIELKLAVLSFYQNTMDVEPNERFIIGIARDECYVSNNSVSYKKKQIADKLCDYEAAVERNQDAKADTIINVIDQMEYELTLLIERHDADLSVYEQINGTKWEAASKKRAPMRIANDRLAALKAKVA